MVEKRLRGALGVSLLSLISAACTESTPPEKSPDAVVAKASSALDGLQVVAVDEASVPTFITGPLGIAPAEASAVASVQAGQLQPVVERVAPLFRLSPGDLYLKKAYVGFDGDAHFRYGVKRNDIDVYGGEVRLHARNGAVFAVNTNVRGDLLAPDKASIAPEAAISVAKADRESPAGATVSGAPRLVYWREGEQLVLAYDVRVKGERADGLPVDDSVLVNASNGDAFMRVSHIHTARNRRVYDGRNQTPLPGVPARTEGDPPVADPIVNFAYDNMGSVYDCFFGLHGRDSYDNAGGVLISTVHHRVNYVNAYWDGTQLIFGDGDGINAIELARAVDITAHELAHAVTDASSGLIYSGESGGMNESMSDVAGAVCEWYSKGKVVDANTWLIGEEIWTPDIPGDALRYMHDPALDGDSLDYYPDYSSGVDVHYSSGISNLAFYLLSQGGTHPRGKTTQAVAGIGIEKAARIFYKMNEDLLLPSSSFLSTRTAAEQASVQLGYDTATTTSVTNAWKAVGVEEPPHQHTTPLQRNVPVTGLFGAASAKKYFSVVVPEGARDLTFTISGGTGDVDLYVRRGFAPTTTSYDCRPYRTGNNETCTFAEPGDGNWYVMLNGFTAYSGVTLLVTWTGGYVKLEPGVEVTGLSGDAGSSLVFTLEIPARENGGTRSVHVRLQGSGNADLYVQRASLPSFSSYDFRGVNEHSTETCNLNGVEPGKFYIQVFGAKGGFTNGSLIATFN
ncbi:M4 family metallopeptidase [Pyxidicoccus parkwayensis]|uniref:M4 family metallopeptidase n=1 Tax=Pyxidicoccus parkwayensis TaxID=2813578 RepID=A0ABX7NSL2_9BACT|nr:M4 family metallopeptidase [Pyxidicoccus parkwaysis]QSQ19148.1 M4 family metallopeptidase [Pyxidicoccus parkwaysis]